MIRYYNGYYKNSINIIKGGMCMAGLSKCSKQEDAILREYYPLGGTKLCQEKGLNRTSVSIKYIGK